MTEESPKKNLVQEAFRAFIQASIDFPASITAQGAAIERYARTNGLSSQEMLGALRQDEGKLSHIAQAADMEHEKKLGQKPLKVSEGIVRFVLRSIQEEVLPLVSQLTDDQLQAVINAFPQFKEKRSTSATDDVEGAYLKFVKKLLGTI